MGVLYKAILVGVLKEDGNNAGGGGGAINYSKRRFVGCFVI